MERENKYVFAIDNIVKKAVEKAISEVAFNQLKLTSLYLHVFAENLPAIKCYKKAGFVVEDEHINSDQKEYTMVLNKVEEE